MKKLGLIGGMSWHSTAEYYEIINRTVNEKLGGSHSAMCLLESLDFAVIEKLQYSDCWNELAHIIIESALRLQSAGAEILIICTNTVHLAADKVQESVNIPLLHIADATAEEINGNGLTKVGLLGTKFTMEKDFYKKRIKEKFNIDVIIPKSNDIGIVNDIIYKELIYGVIKEESRKRYLKIIDDMLSEGASGIILGCTEIPLLIKQEDCPAPLFNTTLIHAKAAVDAALA